MSEGSAISRGCFFCKSGKEKDVVSRFEMKFADGRAVAPTRTRYRRKGDVATEERVALLPGYVFFELSGGTGVPSQTDGGDELDFALRSFSQADSILRLLRYSDGCWQLRDFDDRFAEMMFKTEGNIGVSQAYFDEGNRIRILKGFLKDYEGNIIRVNKRNRTAEISVDFQGKRVSMWLGYELIESVDCAND